MPRAGTQTTMRAIVQDRYGSADVLRLAERNRPTLKADQVLVRVHAAGLDRGTWHLMTGLPYLVRLGFGLRRPRNPVPGRDLAGTVVAVGAQVTRFKVGDEVFGTGLGSWAEHAAAPENRLTHKSAGLSFPEAAVLPVSGLTALQAVRDTGRVQPGHQVLVIGASGGVGCFAVQIARAYGAEVTGVCRGDKADLVRTLGATDVIDYTREDFTTGPTRYDLIIDINGNHRTSQLRRVLAPKGTLVIVGGENGGTITGGMGRPLRAAMLSPFVRQRLTMLVANEHHSGLEELSQLVESGQLTPVVDRSYPLAEAADAMRRLEAGHARGKIAIII
jgi:NADPH:quinone reductase-like Zn-dependent oxidoreductase